jgi:hypothetical protein
VRAISLLEVERLHETRILPGIGIVSVESGEKDNIFPIAASKASLERVKKVYAAFDAASLTEQETFDGPHSFWGKRGLPFLAKNL